NWPCARTLLPRTPRSGCCSCSYGNSCLPSGWCSPYVLVALGEVAFLAQQLEVLHRVRAIEAERHDVVIVQVHAEGRDGIRVRQPAMTALPAVPPPHGGLHLTRDLLAFPGFPGRGGF